MRRTKIVATISDRRCEPEFLKSLITAGVNVIRLNTAHMTLEGALTIIQRVRAISDRVAILVDTKGPEVRTGQLDEPTLLHKGATVRIRSEGPVVREQGVLWVSYPGFVQEVPLEASILLDDGAIGLTVTQKLAHELVCTVQNEGVLQSRKSVNVPAVRMHLASVSAKDEEFIRFAIEHEVDFIAHSFVRGKEDILAIQRILDAHKSSIKIIAKIENREGVEHLSEILDVAFGVMVARGDLAVEIPAYEVPFVQKRIIRECIGRAKPVITATQMLHSMMEYPRPTRAEVSDVANAVLDGTDAIMLSGETASGNYPLEAVRTMVEIATHAESEHQPLASLPVLENTPYGYLAKSAVFSALDLHLAAVVVPTISGRTARLVAAYRGTKTVFAQCCDAHVARELALTYGVMPSTVAHCSSRDALVLAALQSLVAEKALEVSDMIVLLAGAPGEDTRASTLEINTVGRTMTHARDNLN